MVLVARTYGVAMIITGSQRSATMWTQHLFAAAGHESSHERYYREHVADPVPTGHVEVSWAAAAHPILDSGHLVVHQVRHPLAVIGSLVSRRTFHHRMRPSAHWAHAQLDAMGLLPKDWLDQSAQYRAETFWLCWTELAAARSHKTVVVGKTSLREWIDLALEGGLHPFEARWQYAWDTWTNTPTNVSDGLLLAWDDLWFRQEIEDQWTFLSS